MTQRVHRGFESPLSAQRVASGALRLSQPRSGPGWVGWVEGRPEEGGRQVVVGGAPGQVRDLTPRDVNVRSRIHEYGGGEYARREDVLVYSDASGGAWLARIGAGAAGHRRLGGYLSGCRYGDFVFSPDGRFVVAVEEEHRADATDPPANRLVAFELASGVRSVVSSDTDFVSSPTFSPDGARLAHLCWNHPQMPWQGTELRVAPWSGGLAGGARRVAGGTRESIFQPSFAPDGTLFFVSDRSGWWNLYGERGGEPVPVAPIPQEFGLPQWVLGMRSYDFDRHGNLVCSAIDRGVARLVRVRRDGGAVEPVPAPWVEIHGVTASGSDVLLVGAGLREGAGIRRYDGAGGTWETLRRSGEEVPEDWISEAEPVSFSTPAGATSYGFLYRPRAPGGREGERDRAPLVVRTHGGPSAASGPSLDVATLFWTTRGFAVLDVNYRGSTGYGRAYRDALAGSWGIADVEDCAAAAAFAVREGSADPARMAIRGGSAGGYTTLCALTFGDVFGAGASYYGIGDLELLARDTHKFEAHYTDWLVAPLPEGEAIYRARSPVHHADRITCPVIFFQGEEDRVVPPNQAETMVRALEARGVEHEYVLFAAEGHGFRRAETLVRALESELAFYLRVFDLGGEGRA